MEGEKTKLDQAKAAEKKDSADKLQRPEEGRATASSDKIEGDRKDAEEFVDQTRRQ